MKTCQNRWFVSGSASLLVALLISGCEEPKRLAVPPPPPEAPVVTPRSTGPDFPVTWTLTDYEGRKIEATLIGRSISSIAFIRVSDGRRFDLPIQNLSEADRLRVDTLPLHSVAGEKKETPDPPSVEIESGPIRMKRSALEALEEELSAVGRLLSESNSSIKIRSLQSQNDKLMEEKVKLMEEIKELESRQSR